MIGWHCVDTTVQVQEKKKSWDGEIFAVGESWGNKMDRGLGGVKDGLLAIAFTMICDATVLAGWVLKWCINDSSECERFYWLTFLTEH